MPRKPPELRRSSGTIPATPTLLIVCEGRTEASCLTDLRAAWRVRKADVRVVSEAGDPRHLLSVATAIAAEIPGEVEVVVVFDRDDHVHWAASVDTARARGWCLALSNPCVELWGLLLHRDQTAPIDRHAAQRDLAKVHPRYHHEKNPYFDVATVLAHLDDAARRAAALDQRAADTEPLGNPTTGFTAAIVRLRTYANP